MTLNMSSGSAENQQGFILRGNVTATGNSTISPTATAIGVADGIGLAAGNRTFNVVGAGDVLTVSARLTDEVGAPGGALVKTGAGALVLAGVNTHTGGTQVQAGTLRVDGSILGPVTVAAGATLGGSGTFAGPLTLQSGGRLAPGNSPGVLTVGGLVGTVGSVFEAELNGPTPGTGYDQLVVNGIVNLGGMTLLADLGFAATPVDALVLIANDGSDAVIGTFDALPEGALVDLGSQSALITYVGGDGNDVVLFGFTPIPEPTAALLLGPAALAALAALGLRRRR